MVTMTHKKTKSMPKIALYEPDIPQNTAAIARTCSCLGAVLEIIEPCGFLLNDKRFKRVVMDYLDEKIMTIYKNKNPQGSIISRTAPRQEQVRAIAAVFCGISGS